MPVSTQSREYQKNIAMWQKCRIVIEGEDSVKASGETFLPRLSQQSEAEYEAYKGRAYLYGAAGRTVEGLTGAIFSKEPVIEFPKKDLLEHIGVQNESIHQLADTVVQELLSTGRIGLLVDSQPNGESPYIACYYPENIISWTVQFIGGREVISQVILREEVTKQDERDPFIKKVEEQYRELLLVDDERGERSYQQRLWVAEKKVIESREVTEFVLREVIVPTMRGGRRISEIPFYIANSYGLGGEVAKSPLIDLVNMNLSHYRTTADLEHGRHFTALPTPWAAGFDTQQQWCIGSSIAWVSDNPQATAGYLEFSGAGLKSLSEALEEKAKLMAVLGARLLEEQKRDSEAAETVRLRHRGEGSVLGKIAKSASLALTAALSLIDQWQGGGGSKISVELNQDYDFTKLDPATLMALMGAVQSGMMSFDTWFYNLKRGEFMPDSRTSEEERKLIVAVPMQPAIPGRVESGNDAGA